MNQKKTTDSTFINQKILVSKTKTTDSIYETVFDVQYSILENSEIHESLITRCNVRMK